MYHRKYHRFTTVLALLLVCSLLCGSAEATAPAAPQAPSVTAASAIVMDCDSGEVLYEKDADTMRVPASMTKVMTAYLIFEELEAGRLTLDTMVPISAQNARKSLDGSSYPAQLVGGDELHRHGRVYFRQRGGLCPADERDSQGPGYDGGI